MSVLKHATIERQILTSVPEHQTVISWNSDCQNEIFQDWLWLEGLPVFEKYYENIKLEQEDQ